MCIYEPNKHGVTSKPSALPTQNQKPALTAVKFLEFAGNLSRNPSTQSDKLHTSCAYIPHFDAEKQCWKCTWR